jgi:hypothetical protein
MLNRQDSKFLLIPLLEVEGKVGAANYNKHLVLHQMLV